MKIYCIVVTKLEEILYVFYVCSFIVMHFMTKIDSDDFLKAISDTDAEGEVFKPGTVLFRIENHRCIAGLHS